MGSPRAFVRPPRVAVVLLCLALAGGGLPAVVAPPAAAQTAPPRLPPGFERVLLPTGLSDGRVTDFVFLPGGGYLATGKGGEVAFVSADQAEQRTIARLPVYSAQDVGLLGIALSNDYATTGHLYLVFTYTRADGANYARMSRFTVDDPRAPTSLA